MFTFNKVFALGLMLLGVNANAINTSFSSTYVPAHLGNIRVYHNENGFFVNKDGNEIAINSYDTDPVLRNINRQKLYALMHNGYISVNKIGNDYALHYNARLRGGGPVGAVVCATAAKGAVDATAEGVYMGVGWLASWVGGLPAAAWAYHTTKVACMVPQKIIGRTASVAAGIWGATWLPF